MMLRQGGASDETRRRAQGQDPRFHRGDAARAWLSAVGARDRPRGRARLHVGRPSPPPDPRARGLSRAGCGPVARDPPDPDRGDPARPDQRARAAIDDRRRARRADHRRDRGRRTDRGLPGRDGDDGHPGRPGTWRRRLRPARPWRLDDRGPHRRRRLRPHPAADDRSQRRHRRRPGRGERGHPQALLQGEGPDPTPAGQSGLPSPVLRRRPDPGQVDRGHSTAR